MLNLRCLNYLKSKPAVAVSSRFSLESRFDDVVIRQRRLRWPISEDIDKTFRAQPFRSVGRRAKYLLINTSGGTAILHLGMSGSVTIVDADTPAAVHDHVDIVLMSGKSLRFRDPRRFGSLHWSQDAKQHWLLR